MKRVILPQSRSRAPASCGGCKPDLGQPPSLVTGPRILAVRGTPAEAKPSDMPVTYDALIVDVDGRVARTDIGWALCKEPHPPAESNVVSSACLAIPDDTSGDMFAAPVPGDACTNFGPLPSMPGARPADPDVTGGYYQPVRAVWHGSGGDETAFGLERVLCRIGSIAPTDIAGKYASDYVPNSNPMLSSAVLDPERRGAMALFTAGEAAPPPAVVAAGQVVTLQANWDGGHGRKLPGLRHHVAHARHPARSAAPLLVRDRGRLPA